MKMGNSTTDKCYVEINISLAVGEAIDFHHPEGQKIQTHWARKFYTAKDNKNWGILEKQKGFSWLSYLCFRSKLKKKVLHDFNYIPIISFIKKSFRQNLLIWNITYNDIVYLQFHQSKFSNLRSGLANVCLKCHS